MKFILLFALLPFFAAAQDVNPVLSKDYLALIHKVSKPATLYDSTNSLANASLHTTQMYDGNSIGKIKIKSNKLFIKPALLKSVFIAGSFTNSIELKAATRLPSVQTDFVQGRSINGSPVWRGPETGEQFSYGPAINNLDFDGSIYAYDVRGRLVPSGSGDNQKATAYNNSIFRTGASFAQSLNVQAKYAVGGRQLLTANVRLTQKQDALFIKQAGSDYKNCTASAEALIKWLTVSGAYNRSSTHSSINNGNGFLNRLYQDQLLTPVSFDNSQETRLGSGQRAYSTLADNPLFLLENNGNNYNQTSQAANTNLEKKTGIFKFKISQSLEKLQENSHFYYAPGTVSFQNGIAVQRIKTDGNYYLRAMASYTIPHDDYHVESKVVANYIFSTNHTAVDYMPGTDYHFQRSSGEASVSYLTNFRLSGGDAGFDVGDKFYASNTATSTSFFLPSVSGYLRLYNFLGWQPVTAKLVASYHQFNSELPVSTSFNQTNLLQYNTAQTAAYWPVTEAGGFDGLKAIHHSEYNARLELNYEYRYFFSAELYKRNVRSDVFPVFENGTMVFKNLADHRTTGIELEGSINTHSKNLQTTHALSFVTNSSKVIAVADGYNGTPIAGFSNVNKAIIKGEALGVIVGSRWLRDGNNRIIIGADGFPLADATPGVIGNPQPQFVIKTSHSISYKKLSFSVDAEWRKGGDVWNGTQAALDYYGRSQTSASLRNVTNYIFPGVLQVGHINTIPVRFYDPALPFEQNRWVRFGQSGVAEDYIQKGDCIRLNNLSIAYKFDIRKYIQSCIVSLYASNIIVWSAYKGVDANRLLYDQSTGAGLDYFNLPSTKNFGCNLTIQF